jgi:hypothetical protein
MFHMQTILILVIDPDGANENSRRICGLYVYKYGYEQVQLHFET